MLIAHGAIEIQLNHENKINDDHAAEKALLEVEKNTIKIKQRIGTVKHYMTSIRIETNTQKCHRKPKS